MAHRMGSSAAGGGEGTRTLGLYIANVALYQLSYTPAAIRIPGRFRKLRKRQATAMTV